MYEGYETRHTIPVDAIDPDREQSFSTGQFANFIPRSGTYIGGVFPGLVPIWYTDWRDETLSWHLTCSFHAHLNPSPLVAIRGRDAQRFLSENFVNDIENFPVGLIKHGIMCLDDGRVATHGVILRTGDEEYEAYWHSPYLEYAFELGDYDAELEEKTMERYLFQLQGPKVLQILADVTGDDLRDLPFRGFRDSVIDGHAVRILRLGMSGTLGYEVHGPTEFARSDQKKLLEAGNRYGMRQIGIATYSLDHAVGGFAQATNNFLSALVTDEEFLAWSRAQPFVAGRRNYAENAARTTLTGSVGDDITEHLFTPFEIGLGYCVNWNHEFRGKEALRAFVDAGGRRMVTLEWDPVDLADIYLSQFQREEETYKPIDFPGWETPLLGRFVQNTDYVEDAEGNRIGVSIGRTQSHFYRAMISLGVLADGHRDLGDEVFVVWGEPGTRQKRIRARVARYPFNEELANTTLDTAEVPIDLPS